MNCSTPMHVTIYSLATHAVIRQLPFTDASTITVRAAFIVIVRGALFHSFLT